MELPNLRERHTGGPNKVAGKAALIAGTVYRRCLECGHGVFVPHDSAWTTCAPCQKGWRRRHKMTPVTIGLRHTPG